MSLDCLKMRRKVRLATPKSAWEEQCELNLKEVSGHLELYKPEKGILIFILSVKVCLGGLGKVGVKQRRNDLNSVLYRNWPER